MKKPPVLKRRFGTLKQECKSFLITDIPHCEMLFQVGEAMIGKEGNIVRPRNASIGGGKVKKRDQKQLEVGRNSWNR